MSAFHRLLNFCAVLLVSGGCVAGPKPDVEKGKATFAAMCGVCHAVTPTGGPIEGPNLIGVVGRKAGSQPDFGKYTPAHHQGVETIGLYWHFVDLVWIILFTIIYLF